MSQVPMQLQRADARNRGLAAAGRRSMALNTAEDLRTRANRVGMGDIVQNLLAKGSNEDLVRTLLDRLDTLRAPAAAQPVAVATAYRGRARARTLAEAPRQVRLPTARGAETWERALIEGALLAIPIPGVSSMVAGLRAVLDAHGVTVGIGPAAGAGFGLGLGVGAGILFAPGGQLGVYGSLDVRAGIIDSVSAGLQVTIVRGGIDAFNGVGFAAGVAIELGVSVSAQMLLDSNLQFQGVSFEAGVGIGFEPIEVFLAVQSSNAQGLALARAAALADNRSLPAAPQLLPPPPGALYGARAFNAGVIVAAATFVIEQIINNQGDISWNLDQMRGLKHPNDQAPASPPTFHDARTIELRDWPWVDAAADVPLLENRISGWFKVDWQYNGLSLGNVRIANIGTNDAPLWGLRVEARIMDDNILYPADRPTYAALRIRFEYTFSRSIGSDLIAYTDLHLYGNGTYDQTSGWIQQ